MQKRMFISVLGSITLTLGGASSRLFAQADSDSVTLATALAEVVAEQATGPGDHHGPFVLKGPLGSRWPRRVATALRSRHPELVTSSRAHVVHLSIDDVTVTDSTARILVNWSLCTTRQAGLNSCDHVVTYVFGRSSTGWSFQTTEFGEIADGHC